VLQALAEAGGALPAGARVEEVEQVIERELQQLLQVHAAVGELAERPLARGDSFLSLRAVRG